MNTRTKILFFASLSLSLSAFSTDYKFEIDKDVKCLVRTPSGENLTINSKVMGIGESTLKLSKPPVLSDISGDTIDIKKDSCTHLDIEEVEGEYFEVVKVMKKEKVEIGEDGKPLIPTPAIVPEEASVNTLEDISEPKVEIEGESNKKGMGKLWIVLFVVIALSPALIFFKGKGKVSK